MAEVMLSTTDNPFNPFKDFDQWYNYDLVRGYDTCGLLARMTMTSSELPDEINHRVVETAIDELVALMPKTYMKLRSDEPLVQIAN